MGNREPRIHLDHDSALVGRGNGLDVDDRERPRGLPAARHGASTGGERVMMDAGKMKAGIILQSRRWRGGRGSERIGEQD
jgi:hypothetical protein